MSGEREDQAPEETVIERAHGGDLDDGSDVELLEEVTFAPDLHPPPTDTPPRDPLSIDPWTELADDYPPDGPVPAPMDGPGPLQVSLRANIPRERSLTPPPLEPVRVRRRIKRRAPSISEAAPKEAMDQPLDPERQDPEGERPAKKRRLKPAPRVSRNNAPPREYPVMRGLLRQPDEVPDGNAAVPEPPPPPVPGTFFPGPRVPLMRPAPADLDELLTTMAEGLLIGETAAGQTEVRVTLKDEFFAGTELRITVGDGQVHAILCPPNRDVYWQLNANAPQLRERLESKGLIVQSLHVEEPL